MTEKELEIIDEHIIGLLLIIDDFIKDEGIESFVKDNNHYKFLKEHFELTT
jgi:hypothetical protein